MCVCECVYVSACVCMYVCMCVCVCMYNIIMLVPYIAGYFHGVYISRILKLQRFAELVLVKLVENHTHIPSAVTLRVQSLRKFAKYTPLEINPLYGILRIVHVCVYNNFECLCVIYAHNHE